MGSHHKSYRVAMTIPVLIVLIVLRVVHCSVCDSQLARDSYGCCLAVWLYDSHNITECDYLQGQCQAGEGWPTGEDFCDQFTPLKKESWDQLVCKGVKNPYNGSLSLSDNEDISTYDNNTFLWTCDKQPPEQQQPTVVLDPPAGTISIHTKIFYLAVKLTEGFPKARPRLYLPDSVTGVICDNQVTSIDLSGLVTTSCSYQVRLHNRETLLSLVVEQQGFTDKTFEYRVTTTAFPGNTGASGTVHSSFWLILLISWYFIITNQ